MGNGRWAHAAVKLPYVVCGIGHAMETAAGFVLLTPRRTCSSCTVGRSAPWTGTTPIGCAAYSTAT